MKDFVCKCGHRKLEHFYPGKVAWESTWCVACGLGDMKSCWPLCEKYVPDNLKYLEEKYNQQILDKYRSKI